ncbi:MULTISPECIES: hypothetical protein [unclassified Burkholderia]|uniref:hypothetical protein n=1 Tax=unclassified Burkholderia TaxID=2613784 RepID=UPI002AB1A420|nr:MULTISPECIES: hypothetical protein [unclassified Burkholderia]
MNQPRAHAKATFLAGLSDTKREFLKDAEAAGYSITYGDTCVDVVKRTNHTPPRILRGLRMWATGTAFDVKLDLSAARAIRSVDEMRTFLGVTPREAHLARFAPPRDWQPSFSRYRDEGWYVHGVRYPGGAIGCVSNKFPDGRWRILCDHRRGVDLDDAQDFTYPSREAAARAEYALAAAQTNALAQSEATRATLNHPEARSESGEAASVASSEMHLQEFDVRFEDVGYTSIDLSACELSAEEAAGFTEVVAAEGQLPRNVVGAVRGYIAEDDAQNPDDRKVFVSVTLRVRAHDEVAAESFPPLGDLLSKLADMMAVDVDGRVALDLEGNWEVMEVSAPEDAENEAASPAPRM